MIPDFINQIVDGVTEASGSRRISVPLPELRRNLKDYASAAGIEPTDEHLFALKAIFSDHRNVFLTGDAGTGKTTFVKYILLQELNNRGVNFHVTASTGIAGSHLEGKTLHSWAGVGLGPFFPSVRSPVDMNPEDVLRIYQETAEDWETSKKFNRIAREGVKKRLRGAEVLLVDEISMCAGTAFLGYIDFFLRHVRNNQKPFGGVQVIFIGDFCQLPPVERKVGQHADWAFLSTPWREAGVLPIEFTRVFRQADPHFAKFLNRRRLGIPVEGAEEDYVRQFLRQMTPEEALKLSYLVPTNAQADKINDTILANYPEPTTEIPIESHILKEQLGQFDSTEKIREAILKVRVVKEALKLREGLPVLITYNDPGGEFVNGTKGYVHSYVRDPRDQSLIGVQVRIPRTAAELAQLVSMRRQLQNIPADTPVELAEHDKFRYVTLSRRKYVRHSNEDPDETVDVPEEEYGQDGEVVNVKIRQRARFPFLKQFPLIPASAITIHKSQGMSLDECVVDLNMAFAAGHVYVALSRLRTAEGLTLTSSRLPVMADPYAMEFYRQIAVNRPNHRIPL